MVKTVEKRLEIDCTIGMRCGVKLTVTFDCTTSDNPCSISGTAKYNQETLNSIYIFTQL